MPAAAALALLAACSGAPASTPALAPTATLGFGLLLNEPESFEGYTLFSPARRGYARLIDHQGNLVQTWPSAGLARLLDNGNVLSARNMEIDPEGNIVWEFRYPQHHDLLKLPNGNVLILSRDFLPREEAIALGANPDSLACSPAHVRGPRVIEARPTGPESAEIVWEWSVFDHLIQDFDPEKPNYGVVADHPERVDLNFVLAQAPCGNGARWLHANALDYNAELDQIMITVRNFSEFWIIDHSASREEAAGSAGGNAGKGGDLLYRWGNPRAHRAGTPADQRLFWPHAAHWIPEGSPGAGNVLIFNNGWEHPGFERGYSSVDEIVLPNDGYNYRLDAGHAYGPNAVIWTYIADPPESFYAVDVSNAQRMPNGNTLIAAKSAPRIFEVTVTGKTVWDFTYPLFTDLYRAYRYSPDYPGLRGLDLTPPQTLHRDAVKGEPLADALFDLYAADGYLFYAKEQCEQDDLEHPFYLHILPERTDDLQETQRWRGFNNIDLLPYFNSELRESLSDGKCAARTPLPDYPVAAFRTGQQTSEGRALWSAQVWTNPASYRTAYREAVEGAPTARSAFDFYATSGALVYVKERCGQSDIAHRFFLHIVPEQAADLPDDRRRYGFDNLDFDFFLRGALFDGKCAARVPLPNYAVAAIRTGQRTQDGGVLWSAWFSLNPETYRTAYVEAVVGEPLARSAFNLYLQNSELVYAKERCEQDDIAHRFFLHIVPERAEDLSEARLEVGFENLDFDFFLRGALFDGKCAARVPLPDYAVAAIRTGQKTPDGSALWAAQLRLNPEPYRTAYYEAVKGEPLARSVFDLYAIDGALIYAKERCGQSDITDRFFLHIVPERPDDLPEARRESGFENLDFEIFFRGALFDGKCAARVPLPDYPVASIRTGQFSPGGELWSVDVAFSATRR